MNAQYSIQDIFSEFRYSFRLSLPLIASEVIYGLSGFICTIMVAHLGSKALAANALVWSVFIALVVFFIGVLCAVSVLIAQCHGANDKEGVRIATQQGILLAIALSIPAILVVLLAPYILSLTGQNPAVMRFATPYFHSLMWGMLPLSISFVLEQFLLGISKTRLVLAISLLIVPMQIGFSYLFMFGAYGFPKMGLPGIGFGSATAYSIAAMIVGLYVHYAKSCRDYKIFTSHWTLNQKYMKEIIHIGLPIGGMYCIELALLSAIAILMGHIGAEALAAHQIAFQCFGLALTVIFGLSQSTSIRVGHEVGKNSRKALKLAMYVNLGIGLCWMLLLTVLYLGFPQSLIAIDINVHAPEHREIVHDAILFLSVAAILQIIETVRILSAAALRGLKDTKIPMWTSMLGFWCLAFPCAYLFGFVWHLGGVGLWLGLVVGLAIAGAILFIRFHRLANHLDLQALVTRSDGV